MMKQTVVIFTTNNARILINPEHPKLLAKRFNVLLDPDLSRVRGVDPHYWKVVKGEIYPMNHFEAELRRDHVERFGADNDIEHALTLGRWEMRLHSPLFWLQALTLLAALLGGLYCVGRLL